MVAVVMVVAGVLLLLLVVLVLLVLLVLVPHLLLVLLVRVRVVVALLLQMRSNRQELLRTLRVQVQLCMQGRRLIRWTRNKSKQNDRHRKSKRSSQHKQRNHLPRLHRRLQLLLQRVHLRANS